MPLDQRFVIMGPAGCGKSTVGAAVAARIGARYVDGDDLHPRANIEKMSRGEPLTDADRAPWLERIGRLLAEAQDSCIVGCSALKRTYRDMIRAGARAPVSFLFLSGSREVLLQRMTTRPGHFMPVSLLDSQLQTLEPPQSDERAITVDIDQPLEQLVDGLVARILEDAA
ncbi:MAG: gluconokinase, GntK/IdnK-type [Pseudomonadota bacterium]